MVLARTKVQRDIDRIEREFRDLVAPDVASAQNLSRNA